MKNVIFMLNLIGASPFSMANNNFGDFNSKKINDQLTFISVIETVEPDDPDHCIEHCADGCTCSIEIDGGQCLQFCDPWEPL